MAEDAKAYLQKVELLDNLINSKIEEINRLKALSMKITANIKPDVVSNGNNNTDKLGDAVAIIVDLEAEINEAIDELVKQKREVSSVIEKVLDPNHAKLLCKRYLLYEPWEQIATEMGFTYRHITRMHGEALQTVRKLLKNKSCP